MSEGIIIAIIGAAGVVIAAIIKLIGSCIEKKKAKNEAIPKTKIVQNANKENTTLIGIQNNYGKEQKK